MKILEKYWEKDTEWTDKTIRDIESQTTLPQKAIYKWGYDQKVKYICPTGTKDQNRENERLRMNEIETTSDLNLMVDLLFPDEKAPSTNSKVGLCPPMNEISMEIKDSFCYSESCESDNNHIIAEVLKLKSKKQSWDDIESTRFDLSKELESAYLEAEPEYYEFVVEGGPFTGSLDAQPLYSTNWCSDELVETGKMFQSDHSYIIKLEDDCEQFIHGQVSVFFDGPSKSI